jgi:hypothetical protein
VKVTVTVVLGYVCWRLGLVDLYLRRFMPRPPKPPRPEKWQRRAESAAYAPRGEVLKLDR